MKTLKIDKVFHFTDADIKSESIITSSNFLFFLSYLAHFLFLTKTKQYLNHFHPSFLAIKTEWPIIYLKQWQGIKMTHKAFAS